MTTSKAFLVVAAVAVSILSAGASFAASPFKKIRGGILHVSSGVVLPSRVGAFQFEKTKVYGAGGRDAGAEYDVVPVIRGDVYMYPLGTYGKDFNAELRVQQNAITQMNKAVKFVSQSKVQINQAGHGVSGVRVQYELTRSLFDNKMRPCGSQLYLFRDGPWLVQYRFSYPIEQSGRANQQIADFLRLWQWRAQGDLVQFNPIIRYGSRG